MGISRRGNENGKFSHPLNKDLFGTPRYSEAFKFQEPNKQAGLEKTERRNKDKAIFDSDAVFSSMKN